MGLECIGPSSAISSTLERFFWPAWDIFFPAESLPFSVVLLHDLLQHGPPLKWNSYGWESSPYIKYERELLLKMHPQSRVLSHISCSLLNLYFGFWQGDRSECGVQPFPDCVAWHQKIISSEFQTCQDALSKPLHISDV